MKLHATGKYLESVNDALGYLSRATGYKVEIEKLARDKVRIFFYTKPHYLKRFTFEYEADALSALNFAIEMVSRARWFDRNDTRTESEKIWDGYKEIQALCDS